MFLPKKINFESIADDDVIEAIELINRRPLVGKLPLKHLGSILFGLNFQSALLPLLKKAVFPLLLKKWATHNQIFPPNYDN